MRVCGRCGVPAQPPFLAPPAETSPDLDGRPGEPARSTLHRWVLVCPGCRAAAADLMLLKSETAVPEEADPFRRWARLAEGLGGAGEAWLWAAWAADDRGDPAAARDARVRAAAAWGEVMGAADGLRRADVLRRAGAFAEAGRALDAVAAEDDGTDAVQAYLRGLVAAGDAGRHLLSSALRPPARRPHVSHGPAKRVGWWARLTGRNG